MRSLHLACLILSLSLSRVSVRPVLTCFLKPPFDPSSYPSSRSRDFRGRSSAISPPRIVGACTHAFSLSSREVSIPPDVSHLRVLFVSPYALSSPIYLPRRVLAQFSRSLHPRLSHARLTYTRSLSLSLFLSRSPSRSRSSFLSSFRCNQNARSDRKVRPSDSGLHLFNIKFTLDGLASREADGHICPLKPTRKLVP